MVLKSYAKINLSLSVIKKLDNGLHDIQSLFCLINLYDTILIKKIKKKKTDIICFQGPFSKFVQKSDNSIKRVLKAMRDNKLISCHYSIKINKRIPVFGGLGGGSSNAATILKFLIRKKIKKNILSNIIKYVGSDLRLFDYDQGHLENLKKVVKLRSKKKLYFLLVFPKIKCSTKYIYSKVKSFSNKKKFLQKNFSSKNMFIKFIIRAKNDLQLIVEEEHPILSKLLNDIRKERGCYLSRITGSGSVCYGLFLNEYCSKVALNSLRKKYPKFWFSVAKTI